MMSYAMVACVLIRLDARAGEWVQVGALATHLGCGCHVVRAHLAEMAAERRLQLQLQWDATGKIIMAARSQMHPKQPAWEARQ